MVIIQSVAVLPACGATATLDLSATERVAAAIHVPPESTCLRVHANPVAVLQVNVVILLMVADIAPTVCTRRVEPALNARRAAVQVDHFVILQQGALLALGGST